MKYVIEIPDFSPGEGVELEWETGFRIRVGADVDGGVRIAANSAGYRSLARLFLQMSQPEILSGSHIHLDDSNSLVEDSKELIIERE